ncbi:MAG: hypothetical protein ACYCSB_02200 [bacterium]
MFIIFFLAAALIVAAVVIAVGLKTGRLKAMPAYVKLITMAAYFMFVGTMGNYYFFHLPPYLHEQFRLIILNSKPVMPNGLWIKTIMAKESRIMHLDEFFTLFMFSVPALVFLLAILYAPFKKKDKESVNV